MAVSSLKYKSKLGNLTAPAEIDLGGMIPLATVTVGSGGTANAEFTNIPAYYEHLQVRALTKCSNADLTVRAQFNSDTGTNYATHYIEANGSTVAAGAVTSTTYVMVGVAASGTAGQVGGFVLDVLDYSNTSKYKTTRTLSGCDNNGSGYVWPASGLWMSTNAITSIKIFPASGTFQQYASFALYGIKAEV